MSREHYGGARGACAQCSQSSARSFAPEKPADRSALRLLILSACAPCLRDRPPCRPRLVLPPAMRVSPCVRPWPRVRLPGRTTAAARHTRRTAGCVSCVGRRGDAIHVLRCDRLSPHPVRLRLKALEVDAQVEEVLVGGDNGRRERCEEQSHQRKDRLEGSHEVERSAECYRTAQRWYRAKRKGRSPSGNCSGTLTQGRYDGPVCPWPLPPQRARATAT